MQKYAFLKHTADIKFQAFGNTLNKAFENSALAMFNAMYDSKIKNITKREIKVKGNDYESLLCNFLEELIFLLDTKGFFLSRIKVKIDEKSLSLKAECFGDNVKNYSPNIDVKAITYNDMFVKKEKDKFVTQVVLDV